MRPLVIILGPTASGKTALAVRLARGFDGEVLACDSTQVYRGMDIGTGKPSRAERSGIPHHLVDLAEPTDVFTAGEYRRRAMAVLEEVTQRGHLPILTAGTGLYLRALLEGLMDAPERSEPLRARLGAIAGQRGRQHLHRLLARVDPPSAARISPNDSQKLIRALEVCFVTKTRLSKLHQSGRHPLTGYSFVKIGLRPDRESLARRIENRVGQMIERDWLQEVAGLLKRAPRSAKPFDFIGYRELTEHLERQITLEQAVHAISAATRQYAKRQMTWFRKEPGVTWISGFGDEPDVESAASKLVSERLRTILSAKQNEPAATNME